MNIGSIMKQIQNVVLKSKHLKMYLYAVVISGFIIADIIRGNSSISQGLVLWVTIMAMATYVNYKLYLSTNILIMAIITYLILPLLFTIFCVLVSGVFTGRLNMILPFFAITSVYVLMFILQARKTKRSDNFLENIKISLDIVRTFFASALGVMAIYYLMNKNYTYFQNVIVEYSKMTNDELKQLLQILVQTLTLPFIILTSIFRIYADWFLLRKKRKDKQKDTHIIQLPTLPSSNSKRPDEHPIQSQ